MGWFTDKIVAVVLFNGFTGTNICMHVVSDGSRRWMTKTFLRAAFDYPFNTAKVKRITGVVEASNETAIRFNEHLGFSRETVLKDACPSGDLLLMRMYRHECRFLR